MDTYQIWFDLREGIDDLGFCDALDAFMEQLRSEDRIHGHRLQRRKLGFGPDGLGEFHLTIEVADLAQLEDAFDAVAPRTGAMEKRHARVWSSVTNFRSGLYRDFPDPQRVGADPS